MALSMSVSAQDPVHGVDGYYNWTPTMFKNSGQLACNNGMKLDGWKTHIVYPEDMQYVNLVLGIDNANFDEAGGGYKFRGGFYMKETASGEGIMTIKRAYPVVAMKLSITQNNEALKTLDCYMEPEFRWYNPNTGAKEGLKLNGLDGNGRRRLYHFGGELKDIFGRDSVKLNGGNNGYETFRLCNAVHSTPTNCDTAMHFRRLPVEANEKAEIVFAMDLSKICAAATEEGGAICLDTADIRFCGFSIGFLNAYADSAIYDTKEVVVPVVDENGNPVYEEDGVTQKTETKIEKTWVRSKTDEERPMVHMKWVKTFESMDAYLASLTEENNWGDGPAVDPQKEVLNLALYEARKFMANYKFSDQLETLQGAYNTALGVYNNPASTGADYNAQLEALGNAQNDFLASIALTGIGKVNSIVNYGGMGLGLTTDEVTIDSYTGLQMVAVSPDNAATFLFFESGTVSGQKAYQLKTAKGGLVQAKDGSLMIVPAAQHKGSLANVVFGNRGTVEEPGYDFKVGKYYYFINSETGTLEATDEVPNDVEDVSEISDYLFFPMEAEYDPSEHDDVNYPMTQGEGSAWEFNGEPETALYHAYKASFEQFEWDAAAKAQATERATWSFAEGWSANGWRPYSKVEIDKTQTDMDGNPISCMKVSCMDTYDNIFADSVNVTMVETDWATAQGVGIMREHGAYTSALNRVPQPNQLCDSLYAINMNAGINRYFAMKMKSNNPDITFGGLVFFVLKGVEEPNAKMDLLLEKRGDVYVWDLLDAGVSFGDSKACAQYASWDGFTSSEDAVYVDWMRFYSSLDEIPTEEMATAISDVQKEQAGANVWVSGNTVQVIAEGEVSIYTIDAKSVAKAQVSGLANFTLTKGIYVVKTPQGVKKVVVK